MNKVVVFVGVLSGPGCGELAVNQEAKKILSSNCILRCVDTNLAVGHADFTSTGKWSICKLQKTLHSYLRYIKNVVSADVVYMVPGQTFFGVMRYFPFILVAKLLRLRVVCHYHGSRFMQTCSLEGGIANTLARYVIGLGDKSILLTRSIEVKFQNIFGVDAQTVVIPNSVELIDKKEKAMGATLNVLYFSNILVEKGVLDFLQAAKILDNEPRCVFHVAGGGGADVERQVDSVCSASANLTYHGFVGGEEKVKLLRNCDIFVLPTYYSQEGLPVSILEAMGSGMAIITCDIGGIKDVVEDGENGLYVQPKSPEEIVAAINRLLNSTFELSEMSKRNVLKVKERFSVEIFNRNLLEAVLNLEEV